MCIIHLKNSNNSINIKKLKIFREVQTYLHNKRKTQLQCVSLKKTLGLAVIVLNSSNMAFMVTGAQVF